MQKKKSLGLQGNQIFNQGGFFSGGGGAKLFGELCIPLKKPCYAPVRVYYYDRK